MEPPQTRGTSPALSTDGHAPRRSNLRRCRQSRARARPRRDAHHSCAHLTWLPAGPPPSPFHPPAPPRPPPPARIATMTPPLSATLQAWSMQGPALLRAALAAKDAEVRRVRAERDARAAEGAQLRACVDELQAAVDQLVALCTAQVAELAERDHDHDHDHAHAHAREAATKPEDAEAEPAHVKVVMEKDHRPAPRYRPPLSFTATLHDTDVDVDALESVRAGDAAVEDAPPRRVARRDAPRITHGEKVARRESFSGVSSVSSNRPSTNVTLPSSPAGEAAESAQVWDGLFDDKASLRSGDDWEHARDKGWERWRGKTALAPPSSDEQDPTQSASAEEHTLDMRRGELPADVQQFTMEEEGQVKLPIFARPHSKYVGVGAGGQCVIQDAAFFAAGASMPCEMTVALAPEELDSYLTTFIHFEYPDGTMLPFIPVCDMRVKGARGEDRPRLGHDMRGLLRSASYGRDYVRLQLRAGTFGALFDRARALVSELYPDATLEDVYLPKADAHSVELFAQLVSPHPVMRGQRWDASIAELLMESESDIAGEGTLLLRLLEGHGSIKLDFVLHRMQMEDDEGNARAVV